MLEKGYYKSNIVGAYIFVIDGKQCKMENLAHFGVRSCHLFDGTISVGDFGPAPKELQEATGQKNYNIKFDLGKGSIFLLYGILGNDRKSLTITGIYQDVEHLTWITKDEIKELQNAGDPYETRFCPFKIQPENQGKLIWVSGAPGAGKSTTAHLLSKFHNFVYYEGDAFFNHTNPFIPKDTEKPSGQFWRQCPLKGIPQKQIDICYEGLDTFIYDVSTGLDFDKMKALYIAMAQDILQQRNRVGGNWVVAQAVPNARYRQAISQVLGKELIHVTLSLSKDAQKKRIIERHGESNEGLNDWLHETFKIYEKVDESIENGFDIEISPNMSPMDIVKLVLEKIE